MVSVVLAYLLGGARISHRAGISKRDRPPPLGHSPARATPFLGTILNLFLLLATQDNNTNTTPVLDQDGQDAFHRYIQNGGHYMGVHCAATALTNSTMFRQTQGGEFCSVAKHRHVRCWSTEASRRTFLLNLQASSTTTRRFKTRYVHYSIYH